MKNIYCLYDDIAKEPADVFLANNDEHALMKVKNDLQKNPLEIRIQIYKVCSFDVYPNKELLKSFDCGDFDCIYRYPETIQKEENNLKDEIERSE